MYTYKEFREKTHRLIPSRFPPVNLFDWAESQKELEELALLEGLTNDRLTTEYGHISLVTPEDWVGGVGATPLMAAFTHFGQSRFSDGTSYGIYYAGDSLQTAIAETKFHREQFLAASNEPPCIIQMREYTAFVTKKIVDISDSSYQDYLNPDINYYSVSQEFGRQIKMNNEWGILYPSVRNKTAQCVAIFRPPALTIPVQAGHYNYVWNGNAIFEVRKSIKY
ncbi:RES family NAD+ phosphorylase [Legionella sp. CNM-1927-20]|uniref:RES family NAD+ phosphorylase n=1 Tax=Legionella sp. CNM-1927-20 TaxID=3422221 RepID=UPI00403ADBF4